MKNQKPTKSTVRRSKRKEVEEVETEMVSVEVGEHVETEMASEEVDKHTKQESEPVQTTHYEVKKKRVRGPTKMRKLAKEAMEKLDVDFDVSGEHSGRGSVTLSSFLGTLVREYVPVLVDDWRAVDGATKDRMWDEIKARFNIEEGWQRQSVFTKMCGIWRSSKSRLVAKLRQTKNANERLKLKPSNIHSLTSWNNWVKSRTSAAFKVKSEKYRKLRKSQIPHTTSRKGMFRLSMDMKKKSSDPKKVTRSKVWLAGHTHSDGRPVKKEFADTIERIQAIDSQMDSTATENVREDAVSQVLGKDRYERVRGMGRGISLNKLDILNARDSYVQKLLATQVEMATKIENMQSQLDCLAGKKRSGADLDAQSNVSNTNKGGIKCKILDWFSKDEVVVGEGEFCTFDKGYKIGKIPIGPNAAAIILHSATIPDASIWRPTATVSKISQAVGVEIPWPDDKVVLESNNNSPTEHNMASDEQPIYNIFAWNGTDIVAEGIICSVDENEKVNQIPLGPNAAIIKVLKVIDHGAFLWRPTAEMALMGDVLNECIQWPLDKIDVDVNTSPEVSPKKST